MLYRILFFGLLVLLFLWGTSRGDGSGHPGLVIATEPHYVGGH